MIASHYLDALEADPERPTRRSRGEARRWFTRAAERAASLAASLEAQRAFERAAGLAGEEAERGNSLARAGDLAVMGGRFDEAESLLSEAITILDPARCPRRRGRSTGQARRGLFLVEQDRGVRGPAPACARGAHGRRG